MTPSLNKAVNKRYYIFYKCLAYTSQLAQWAKSPKKQSEGVGDFAHWDGSRPDD